MNTLELLATIEIDTERLQRFIEQVCTAIMDTFTKIIEALQALADLDLSDYIKITIGGHEKSPAQAGPFLLNLGPPTHPGNPFLDRKGKRESQYLTTFWLP
jgi:hypothetical protein